MAVRLVMVCVTALAWSALGPGTARADTTTVTSGADATLFESPLGDVANGAGEYIFAGTTARDSRRRALIRFDLGAAAIPAGATLTSVTLRLHVSRTISASEPVTIHRVQSSWGEGPSDALLEEGGGAAAEPGDATWLHTFYPTANWTTAGGDFDAAAHALTSVIGNGFYGWSSPALVTDVQSWIAAPAENHGWLVRGNEDFGATAKRFESFQHADLALRPALIIEYVPEPAASAALVLLLLSRLWRTG